MTLHATDGSPGVGLVRADPTASAASAPSHLRVILPDGPSLADAPAQPTTATARGTFDIGAFELVRQFVDHLVAERAKEAQAGGLAGCKGFDWEAVTTSVAGATSLEVAIGRALASADRMLRAASSEGEVVVVEPDPLSSTEATFFAFTQADAVPDFGDDRYRSRLARRVANIIGMRPATATNV